MCTRDIIEYSCPCDGRAGELHPCQILQIRPPGICCYTSSRILKLPHKCKACMRKSLNKLIATKLPLIRTTKLDHTTLTQAAVAINITKQANLRSDKVDKHIGKEQDAKQDATQLDQTTATQATLGANITKEPYTQFRTITTRNNTCVPNQEHGDTKDVVLEDAIGLAIYFPMLGTTNQRGETSGDGGEKSKDPVQDSVSSWLIDTKKEVLDHTRRMFNVIRGLPEGVEVDLPADFGDLEKWWDDQNLGTEFIDMLGQGPACVDPVQGIGLCDANQDYYNPDYPNHCSFSRGDQIQVYRYSNADWWLGVNLETGKGGYFQKELVTLHAGSRQFPEMPRTI